MSNTQVSEIAVCSLRYFASSLVILVCLYSERGSFIFSCHWTLWQTRLLQVILKKGFGFGLGFFRVFGFFRLLENRFYSSGFWNRAISASVLPPDNCKNKAILCCCLCEKVTTDVSVHFEVPFHFSVPEFYQIPENVWFFFFLRS